MEAKAERDAQEEMEEMERAAEMMRSQRTTGSVPERDPDAELALLKHRVLCENALRMGGHATGDLRKLESMLRGYAQRHRCGQDGNCVLRSLKAGATYDASPALGAGNKRVFLASGDQFVCNRSLREHACGPERCQRQVVLDAGQGTCCELTGRWLGAEFSYAEDRFDVDVRSNTNGVFRARPGKVSESERRAPRVRRVRTEPRRNRAPEAGGQGEKACPRLKPVKIAAERMAAAIGAGPPVTEPAAGLAEGAVAPKAVAVKRRVGRPRGSRKKRQRRPTASCSRFAGAGGAPSRLSGESMLDRLASASHSYEDAQHVLATAKESESFAALQERCVKRAQRRVRAEAVCERMLADERCVQRQLELVRECEALWRRAVGRADPLDEASKLRLYFELAWPAYRGLSRARLRSLASAESARALKRYCVECMLAMWDKLSELRAVSSGEVTFELCAASMLKAMRNGSEVEVRCMPGAEPGRPLGKPYRRSSLDERQMERSLPHVVEFISRHEGVALRGDFHAIEEHAAGARLRCQQLESGEAGAARPAASSASCGARGLRAARSRKARRASSAAKKKNASLMDMMSMVGGRMGSGCKKRARRAKRSAATPHHLSASAPPSTTASRSSPSAEPGGSPSPIALYRQQSAFGGVKMISSNKSLNRLLMDAIDACESAAELDAFCLKNLIRLEYL